MAALQSFTTLIACLPCSCQTHYSIRGLLFGEGSPFSWQLFPGEHKWKRRGGLTSKNVLKLQISKGPALFSSLNSDGKNSVPPAIKGAHAK